MHCLTDVLSKPVSFEIYKKKFDVVVLVPALVFTNRL